jgi:hypothetical protein
MAELDAESHDDEPGDEQCQLDWQIQHAGEGEGQGQENGQAGKYLRHARQSDVVLLVLHRRPKLLLAKVSPLSSCGCVSREAYQKRAQSTIKRRCKIPAHSAKQL